MVTNFRGGPEEAVWVVDLAAGHHAARHVATRGRPVHELAAVEVERRLELVPRLAQDRHVPGVACARGRKWFTLAVSKWCL